MDGNALGCLDSEAYTVPSDFQNRDLDVIGNDNLLIFLTANDQHARFTPVIGAFKYLEKYTGSKNTGKLRFRASN